MRYLALVLLAACGAPAPAPAVPAPPTPVQRMIASTVYLEKSGCTGVKVGGNRVLSAKHCVTDGLEDGDAWEGGTIVHLSPAYDFVVLEVEGLAEPVRLVDYALGQHLYVVGYPMQLGSGKQALTVTDGVVAGPEDSDKQIRITAPVYFGNSGGGVWSDDGELLGLAVSIYAANIPGYRFPMPYAGSAFMVPAALIRPWL